MRAKEIRKNFAYIEIQNKFHPAVSTFYDNGVEKVEPSCSCNLENAQGATVYYASVVPWRIKKPSSEFLCKN